MNDPDYNESNEEFENELAHFYDLAEEVRSSDVSLVDPIHEEFEAIEKRYAEKEFHSRGGMKKVCRVLDLKTGRHVAFAEVREDKDDEENIANFLREGRIIAALEHPNIIPIYDIGLNDFGKPFFTMKFLKDQNLHKILKELLKQNPAYTEQYTLNVLLDIFQKVCDAVAYAHSRNVVHLDLKPENIMIGDYGEVYVCDWGLAKFLGERGDSDNDNIKLDFMALNNITLDGVVKGTPGFMAPEQVDRKLGKKDTRTDIYALGAILYNILTFRRPFFDNSTKDVLYKTIHGEPENPLEIAYFPIPESILAICNKAMAKQKSERYESLEQLLLDLRAFQNGLATVAEEASLAKMLLFQIKQRKVMTGFVVLSIFTATVFGLLYKRGSRFEKLLVKEQERIKNIVIENSKVLSKTENLYAREKANLNRDIKKADFKLKRFEKQLELINSVAERSISLNFTKIDYEPHCVLIKESEVAGVEESGFWQNIYLDNYKEWGLKIAQKLKNNLGNVTEVEFSHMTFSDEFYSHYKPNIGSFTSFNSGLANANNKLVASWADFSDQGSFVFKNLNKFAEEYDLIIYSVRDIYGEVKELTEYKVNEQTLYIADKELSFKGPFLEGKAATIEEGREDYDSNYIRFRALKDDVLELKFRELGDSWTTICGIQIVKRK